MGDRDYFLVRCFILATFKNGYRVEFAVFGGGHELGIDNQGRPIKSFSCWRYQVGSSTDIIYTATKWSVDEAKKHSLKYNMSLLKERRLFDEGKIKACEIELKENQGEKNKMINVKELKIIECPLCGSDTVTKKEQHDASDKGLYMDITYTCSKCGRSKKDYSWNTISKNEKIIIQKNEYIKSLEKEIQELKGETAQL